MCRELTNEAVIQIGYSMMTLENLKELHLDFTAVPIPLLGNSFSGVFFSFEKIDSP